MTVKVKICGVRTLAILEAASSSGADLVGLMLVPKSPRCLSLEEAGALADAARGTIVTVAILVDPDDALLDRVAEAVRPDLLQLHASETPERVAAIKARVGIPVIKAIAVAEAGDVAGAEAYAGIADHILFDTKPAPGAVLTGGNGVPFDWRTLTAAKAPFALSGGLDPDNVGEAIRLTGATLVDVSSGVEKARGVKDEMLIKRFVQAVRRADQEQAKAS